MSVCLYLWSLHLLATSMSEKLNSVSMSSQPKGSEQHFRSLDGGLEYHLPFKGARM